MDVDCLFFLGPGEEYRRALNALKNALVYVTADDKINAVKTRLKIADCHCKLRDTAAALRVLDEVTSPKEGLTYPVPLKYLLLHARLLEEEGKVSSATAIYLRVVAAHPNVVEAAAAYCRVSSSTSSSLMHFILFVFRINLAPSVFLISLLTKSILSSYCSFRCNKVHQVTLF
jgi:hypothetical protein